MAYPAGLPLRPVSFGAAVILEDGTPLTMTLEIKASRSLVWGPTGDPLVSFRRTFSGGVNENRILSLPVTDSPNYRTTSGLIVDVSDGKQSHSYSGRVVFMLGNSEISRGDFGPFVLPQADGSVVDIDLLIPVTDSDTGQTISFPDAWSAIVAQAQAVIDNLPVAMAEEVNDEDSVFSQAVTARVASDVESADIPGQVALGIQSSPTVIAAVGAAAIPAVDAALDDAGLLHSEGLSEDAVEFASADDPDNPLFKFSKLQDQQGWKLAFAYANGEVAFGIRHDGTYYPPVATDIPLPTPVAGPDIYTPGDSLTVGSGGGGTTYPSTIQTLLTADGKPGTVYNGGVGGESSRTIAGRAGGRPMLVTVAGGVLPASGSVGVTLTSDVPGLPVAPLFQGTAFAGVNPVEVGGVQWTLSKDPATDLYSLTRITPGAAIPADYQLALLTAARTARRNNILIMQWGQNDGELATTDTQGTELISRLRSQIEWQNSAQKKYLVLGFVTGGIAARQVLHDNMRREFGRRFVNVLEFMLTPEAFRIAGITPTSDDVTDIANKVKPHSFWASTTPGDTDSVHNNAFGYKVTGYLAYNRLKELGDI